MRKTLFERLSESSSERTQPEPAISIERCYSCHSGPPLPELCSKPECPHRQPEPPAAEQRENNADAFYYNHIAAWLDTMHEGTSLREVAAKLRKGEAV